MKKPIFLLIITLMVGGAVVLAKMPKVEPSYAWKVMPPLGLHEPATIDTLFENYSLNFVPSGVSPAYALTGNYGAEGYNLLYFERPAMSDFFFRDAISHWVPAESKTKFYNTRIPMTLMSYNFGGGKENSQERLDAIFSGNINPVAQVGAMVDYLYSKGCYNYQAAKNLSWGFSGSYIGNRYEFQGYFFHFNLVDKENGGIEDDLYITDPAEIQGGNTSVNAKDIPTRLNQAHNRIRGTELYLNSRYKVGFYEEEQINDTTVKRTYVPVSSFIWTLKYTDGTHRFVNQNQAQNLSFWNDTYVNPYQTNDHSRYFKLRNTLGISLLEGFHKYAKAGLAAYVSHELRKYEMTSYWQEIGPGMYSALSPIPSYGPYSQQDNMLRLGAQLTKQRGSLLRYDATAEFGILGEAAGEVEIQGNLKTNIRLFGDTVNVGAYGEFRNETVPWLMRHYYSNHFIWNNDFGKTRTLRVGGDLYVPWTDTYLTAGVENVQNLTYFDENALPAQYGGSAQVVSATLRQNFRFGPVEWQNRLTYQTSSQESVIPLPKLAVHTNLFVRFRVATLQVQFGADCDYYTRYRAVAFQPATMAFYNQREATLGNYPFINLYFNFKLSRTRFYIMMSHINQGMTGDNYFAMPHYPLNPRRLLMGLSVDFAN